MDLCYQIKLIYLTLTSIYLSLLASFPFSLFPFFPPLIFTPSILPLHLPSFPLPPFYSLLNSFPPLPLYFLPCLFLSLSPLSLNHLHSSDLSLPYSSPCSLSVQGGNILSSARFLCGRIPSYFTSAVLLIMDTNLQPSTLS